MTFLYVLLALFVFGLLVMIHELGHFLVARAAGVGIREFSIGMGPKLLSRKGGVWHFGFSGQSDGESEEAEGPLLTEYSLRILPIGGYVSMVGEDEASEDPTAFGNKKVWQRILIVLAGPVMNVVLGFLLMIGIVIATPRFASTTVARFQEGATSPLYGLEVGDTVTHVNGVRVFTGNELIYEILNDGHEPVDLTVRRNGERIVLEDVIFPTMESQGVLFGAHDFFVLEETKTFGTVLKHGFTRSCSTVKMVLDSFGDMLRGRYGINAVSGPVGVTEQMVDAAKSGAGNFLYLVTVITINLGVFNLLPVPALDGGRLLFLLVEAVTRKPVNKNIEGYVHFAGLLLLLGLMAIIFCKDIAVLFIK